MAKRGDPSVLRLIVVLLRAYAGMTQAELGKASRIAQSDVSRFELGRQAPSEEALRRMADAAGVPWPVVLHLRHLFATIQSMAVRRGTLATAEGLDPALLEPALLAVVPYLGKDEPAEPAPEEARREAEEIWTALEGLPARRRRRLVELALGAFEGRALAERIRAAAAQGAADAPDLAALARFIGQASS